VYLKECVRYADETRSPKCETRTYRYLDVNIGIALKVAGRIDRSLYLSCNYSKSEELLVTAGQWRVCMFLWWASVIQCSSAIGGGGGAPIRQRRRGGGVYTFLLIVLMWKIGNTLPASCIFISVRIW